MENLPKISSKKMNIALYAHGGSANHGCEALVRSTIKVLGTSSQYAIYSERPLEDKKYGLDQIAKIYPTQTPIPTKGFPSLLYKIRKKISHGERVYYQYLYRNLLNTDTKYHLALAIGGDNYCYSGFQERFGVQNQLFEKKDIKIALWGCSIDPDRIDTSLAKDLKKYQFITARESLTYEALRDHSLKNVLLIPDTAFLLDAIEKELPKGFQDNNTIGINISPLVIKQEKESGIIIKNLEILIGHILDHTDMSVALIPHVVWKDNDDRKPLSLLFQKYKQSGRVVLIPDDNAMVLKGYIRRCRFLIAARTHASIAGYSSGVPTLVIGYSIKSKGIAKDLFGTDNGYVIPIQSIDKEQMLRDSFIWLQSNEKDIHKKYQETLPTYFQGFDQIKDLLNCY